MLFPQQEIDFDVIEQSQDDSPEIVIEKVCDRIVKKFQPQQVILFGSHSKGKATSNSDIDLLVIIDNENILAPLKQRERYAEILRLFRHKRFGLDAIVLTNEEVKRVISEDEGGMGFNPGNSQRRKDAL